MDIPDEFILRVLSSDCLDTCPQNTLSSFTIEFPSVLDLTRHEWYVGVCQLFINPSLNSEHTKRDKDFIVLNQSNESISSLADLVDYFVQHSFAPEIYDESYFHKYLDRNFMFDPETLNKQMPKDYHPADSSVQTNLKVTLNVSDIIRDTHIDESSKSTVEKATKTTSKTTTVKEAKSVPVSKETAATSTLPPPSLDSSATPATTATTATTSTSTKNPSEVVNDQAGGGAVSENPPLPSIVNLRAKLPHVPITTSEKFPWPAVPKEYLASDKNPIWGKHVREMTPPREPDPDADKTVEKVWARSVDDAKQPSPSTTTTMTRRKKRNAESNSSSKGKGLTDEERLKWSFPHAHNKKYLDTMTFYFPTGTILTLAQLLQLAIRWFIVEYRNGSRDLIAHNKMFYDKKDKYDNSYPKLNKWRRWHLFQGNQLAHKFVELFVRYVQESRQKHQEKKLILSRLCYIYCDIVTPQLVGAMKTKLLYVLPLKSGIGTTNDNESFHYEEIKFVQYSKVESAKYKRISFELRTEYGDLIPFVGSFNATYLALHFRKAFLKN